MPALIPIFSQSSSMNCQNKVITQESAGFSLMSPRRVQPHFRAELQWQKSFQRVSKLESDRPRRTVVVGAVALGGNGGLSRKSKITTINDAPLRNKCVHNKFGISFSLRTICVEVAKPAASPKNALEDDNAVAMKRSDGANHIADKRGGVAIAIGPVNAKIICAT